MNIPDYAIERLARCMLPLIQKYYESEDGQQELAKWKNARYTQEACTAIGTGFLRVSGK